MSSAIAISMRWKLRAWVSAWDSNSSCVSFDSPTTIAATSLPNSLDTRSRSMAVSSITSCRMAAMSVS